MLPAQLVDEVKALCEEGLTATLTEADAMANIVISNYPLRSGHFNKLAVELLLRFPLSYPHGKPDMFWTDEDLLLKDNRVPKNTEQIEVWLGKKWRRFSWHSAKWNPGSDNLVTYLEFVNNRLAKPE